MGKEEDRANLLDSSEAVSQGHDDGEEGSLEEKLAHLPLFQRKRALLKHDIMKKFEVERKEELDEIERIDSKSARKRKLNLLAELEVQKIQRGGLSKAAFKKMKKSSSAKYSSRNEPGKKNYRRRTLLTRYRAEIRNSLLRRVGENPRIIIDMGFGDDTKQSSLDNVCKQLGHVVVNNFAALRPSKLFAVGMNESVEEMLKEKASNAWLEEKGLFESFEKNLLDVFHKDEIVYLSADAEETITSFESSKAYAIGGILDHNNLKGLTFKKAKELGIACAKLPIEDYLRKRGREAGKKVLTINQVAAIISDHMASQSWVFALDRNAPARVCRSVKHRPVHSGLRPVSWAKPDNVPPTALVLGASSGLGLAFSKRLRTLGYTIIMVSRGVEKLSAAAAEVRLTRPSIVADQVVPEVLTSVADASLKDDVARLTLALERSKLDLDIVIATSGTFRWDEELGESKKNFLWEQNFLSKVHVADLMLPTLCEELQYTREGHQDGSKGSFSIKERTKISQGSKRKKLFICVGSEAGTPNFETTAPDAPKQSQYLHSMKAVRTWGEAMLEHLKPFDHLIKFHLVQPPLVDTPLARTHFTSLDWSKVPSAQAFVEGVLQDLQKQHNNKY